jgi:hypothetical protein
MLIGLTQEQIEDQLVEAIVTFKASLNSITIVILLVFVLEGLSFLLCWEPVRLVDTPTCGGGVFIAEDTEKN